MFWLHDPTVWTRMWVPHEKCPECEQFVYRHSEDPHVINCPRRDELYEELRNS